MKTITFIESSKRILSIFCIIYLAYETIWIPTEIVEGVFDKKHLITEILLDSVTCIIIAAINVLFSKHLEHFCLGKTVTDRRVVIIGLLFTMLNTMIILPIESLNSWIYSWFFGRSVNYVLEFVNTYAIAVITILIMSIDVVRRWQVWESEQKRRALVYKMESIVNKIDPHYFFNNISAGVSLIRSNPEKAKTFFTHMSALYRRSMSTYMRKEVPLCEDLDMAKDYFWMLGVRFGDMVNLVDEVPTANDRMIWAGTLQILMENSVKHNEFTKDKPLNIVIRIDNDTLVVSNEYRPREERLTSMETGGEVLQLRYGDDVKSGPEPNGTTGNLWVVRIKLKQMKQ